MTKLDELKAAYEAATLGEWISQDDRAPNMAAVGTGEGGWLGLAQMFGDTQKEANANATFIALSHNAMPTLLDAVEQRDELMVALGQALPLINAYRRVFGGDGDIAAMTIRAALLNAQKGQQP